ncbi:MAG TPA: phage major capsid protein, partial [Nocardioides sp.]|nr:phage major capsid protein [Nocardioides sp.]
MKRQLGLVPVGGHERRSYRPATASSRTSWSAAAEAAQRSAITSGGDDTAVAHEAQRQKAISNLCRANKIDPRTEEHWIRSGKPLDQVSEELVKVMEERGKDVNTDSPAFLGMERGEVERYSISRAIHAIANKNWGKAGLELKAHEAIAKRLGRAVEENSILVPLEVQDRLSAQVLARQAQARGQRDFNTSTGGGAYLIETQNVGFMELLRNRSVFLNMGAMRIPSLTGSVTIPRQSAAGTAYWLANETSQLTESNPTLVQMTLTPKTVGAYTEISRQLLLQSAPGADIIVMNDIARVVALGIDAAGFTGTGSNGQPQGLTGGGGISGVGSVTGT